MSGHFTRPRGPRTHARRGGLYALVLGVSMLVVTIGMGALLLADVESRTLLRETGVASSQYAARSAIEIGVLAIARRSDWRTTLPIGAWLPATALGDAQMSLRVADPTDASLADDPADPVILTGTGEAGSTRYILSLRLQPVEEPLDALDTCLHADGDVTVSSTALPIFTNAPLSSNGAVDVRGTVTGNVEAQTVTNPALVVGTVTTSAPSKSKPDAAAAGKYVALARAIPAIAKIESVAIAAGVNPYGATSVDGVYFMDTGNANVTIRSMRLEGTLIIRCGTGTVTISDSVFMAPARADYPTLIVQGNLQILADGAKWLSESNAGTSFNPAGAPYEGVADADTKDVYPSEIRGLVHVTGNLELRNTTRVRGCVICERSALIEDTIQIIHDEGLVKQPPLYYVQYRRMMIPPDGWTQEVLPAPADASGIDPVAISP